MVLFKMNMRNTFSNVGWGVHLLEESDSFTVNREPQNVGHRRAELLSRVNEIFVPSFFSHLLATYVCLIFLPETYQQ